MTSVGSLCTYLDDGPPVFPSTCVKVPLCPIPGCEIEEDEDDFRCGGSIGAGSLFCRKAVKSASAAFKVGSSLRTAAGVPVLDRDRLVDFPKDPDSGGGRRGSLVSLLESLADESDMKRKMLCLPRIQHRIRALNSIFANV